MTDEHSKPNRGALSANADTWALLAGVLVGLVVLGAAFLRQVSVGQAAIRAALGFLIAYAVVFLLVRFVMRIALHELAEEAVARRHERQHRREEAKKAGSAEAGPGEDGS